MRDSGNMRSGATSIVAALLLIGSGCAEDCTVEACSDSSRTYQSCLDGVDFVLRDSSGVELARCETDYVTNGVVVGEDRNGCRDKHAGAKVAYCNGELGGPLPMTNPDAGTSPAGRSYCRKARANGTCVCASTADPSNFPEDSVEVASCGTEVGLVEPVCCVITDGAGRAQSCNCTSKPYACREDGSKCSCPNFDAQGDLDGARSSCAPSNGRICCQSDSHCKCAGEQYPGAGCIGFGGFNEDAVQVASCTGPGKPQNVCAGSDDRHSCVDLEWAP